MIRFGTCYFRFKSDAIAYYADYGFASEDVDRKIAEGEIHIGVPPMLPGDKLYSEDGRYGIERN